VTTTAHRGTSGVPNATPEEGYRIVYEFNGHDTCARCGTDTGVPIEIGVELPLGGRLCCGCTDDAMPGFGFLLEGLDTLDGALATATDDRRRILLAEMLRGVEHLHQRWTSA
jgi:hypothetical protein